MGVWSTCLASQGPDDGDGGLLALQGWASRRVYGREGGKWALGSKQTCNGSGEDGRAHEHFDASLFRATPHEALSGLGAQLRGAAVKQQSKHQRNSTRAPAMELRHAPGRCCVLWWMGIMGRCGPGMTSVQAGSGWNGQIHREAATSSLVVETRGALEEGSGLYTRASQLAQKQAAICESLDWGRIFRCSGEKTGLGGTPARPVCARLGSKKFWTIEAPYTPFSHRA